MVSRMSILSRSSCVIFLIVSLTVKIGSAVSDPSDLVRGRYVLGKETDVRTISINFSPSGSFWVAQVSLDNFSENGFHISVLQPSSSAAVLYFRPATDTEWTQANLRLFFDARFWKKVPGLIRPVLVRCVHEEGVKSTLYVEPLP